MCTYANDDCMKSADAFLVGDAQMLYQVTMSCAKRNDTSFFLSHHLML